MNIDKKDLARIINAMRKVFRFSETYKKAMNKNKIDTMLYKCDKCSYFFYIGKSEANFKKYLQKYKKVKTGKLEVDHKEPVVPIGKSYKEMTLDEYCSRLFCSITNLKVLCVECHKKKTNKEREKRKAKKRGSNVS